MTGKLSQNQQQARFAAMKGAVLTLSAARSDTQDLVSDFLVRFIRRGLLEPLNLGNLNLFFSLRPFGRLFISFLTKQCKI